MLIILNIQLKCSKMMMPLLGNLKKCFANSQHCLVSLFAGVVDLQCNQAHMALHILLKSRKCFPGRVPRKGPFSNQRRSPIHVYILNEDSSLQPADRCLLLPSILPTYQPLTILTRNGESACHFQAQFRCNYILRHSKRNHFLESPDLFY